MSVPTLASAARARLPALLLLLSPLLAAAADPDPASSPQNQPLPDYTTFAYSKNIVTYQPHQPCAERLGQAATDGSGLAKSRCLDATAVGGNPGYYNGTMAAGDFNHDGLEEVVRFTGDRHCQGWGGPTKPSAQHQPLQWCDIAISGTVQHFDGSFSALTSLALAGGDELTTTGPGLLQSTAGNFDSEPGQEFAVAYLGAGKGAGSVAGELAISLFKYDATTGDYVVSHFGGDEKVGPLAPASGSAGGKLADRLWEWSYLESFAIAAIDLDRDGIDELAVTWTEDGAQLYLKIYKVSADGTALSLGPAAAKLAVDPYWVTRARRCGADTRGVSLAAFDFDGNPDGGKELAVGYVGMAESGMDHEVKFFRSKASGALALEWFAAFGQGSALTLSCADPSSRTSLAAGDIDGDGKPEAFFLFDNGDGLHLAKLVSNPRNEGDDNSSYVDSEVIDLAAIYRLKPALGPDDYFNRYQVAVADLNSDLVSEVVLHLQWASAVEPTATWTSLQNWLYSYDNARCTKTSSQAHCLAHFADQLVLDSVDMTQLHLQPDAPTNYGAGSALLLADVEGDSLMLGPPEHLILQDFPSIKAMLLGPPKHIDAFPGTGTVNVSLDKNFTAAFTDKSGTAIETKGSDSSSWNVGAKVSATGTVTLGVPKADSVSTAVTASAGTTYGEKEESFNRDYATTSIASGTTASLDDAVIGALRTVHIWRYPVLGPVGRHPELDSGQTGEQLYIQIARPVSFASGGGGEDVYAVLPGTTLPWFQPIHEPGNLFSYPWTTAQLAAQASEQQLVVNFLAEPRLFGTGGVSDNYQVSWSDTSSTGGSQSTTAQLAVDSSVTVSGTATVYEGVTLGASATVSGHYDQSWGSMTYSSTELSSSKGITVNVPQLDGASQDRAYSLTSFVYTEDATVQDYDGQATKPNGAIKVGYTVDLKTQGTSWWSATYVKPDLALNLPFRWSSSGQFATDKMFLHQFKGLFLQDEAGNSLGYAVSAGTSVGVKVRVYNYSFVPVPAPFKVRFEYQAVKDGAPVSTDGHPLAVGSRQLIGEEVVQPLPGFQNPDDHDNWTFVTTAWDTTGLSGNYYLWVTVDPDNELSELDGHDYEPTDPPGSQPYSNNAGWFGTPIFVQASSSAEQRRAGVGGSTGTARSGQTGSASLPDGIPDVSIDTVAVRDGRATAGEEFVVAARVSNRGDPAMNVWVEVSNGDPAAEGRAFRMFLIPYLGAGETFELLLPGRIEEEGSTEIHVLAHRQYRETETANNRSFTPLEIVHREEGGDGPARQANSSSCDCSSAGARRLDPSFLLLGLLLATWRLARAARHGGRIP